MHNNQSTQFSNPVQEMAYVLRFDNDILETNDYSFCFILIFKVFAYELKKILILYYLS